MTSTLAEENDSMTYARALQIAAQNSGATFVYRMQYTDQTLRTSWDYLSSIKIELTDEEMELCNFHPNLKQKLRNRYVSVPFYSENEKNFSFRKSVWKWKRTMKPEMPDILNTVFAIYELRELARFMKINPENFLDYYYEAYKPTWSASRIMMTSEQFNSYSTKFRMDLAGVYLPRLDGAAQKALYDLDPSPCMRSRRRWHELYEILHIPQQRTFLKCPGLIIKHGNFHDTEVKIKDVCTLVIHPEQKERNQFVSVPRPHLDAKVHVKWDSVTVDLSLITNHENTVILISEYRELARYKQTEPSEFLDNYYKIKQPWSPSEMVSIGTYNDMATRLKALRGNVKVPVLEKKKQEELYNLDLHVTDQDDNKWRRFYEIMNWQSTEFPKKEGERQIYTNTLEVDEAEMENWDIYTYLNNVIYNLYS